MKEVALTDSSLPVDARSFLACLATVLELPVADVPRPSAGESVSRGWAVSRWLGGLGLGLARVADPSSFTWPGPWIARIRPPDSADRRWVVMYGVPSGVVWDPAGSGEIENAWIEDGFLVAAADIALALPQGPAPAIEPGTVESICIAPAAGAKTEILKSVRAIPGQGLSGDRHVSGTGTFPSGLPGSALTLIQAEVCESFEPPLRPDEHRRNVVTRGIELNGLVGREFTIGEVRCRGTRLCEPCKVVQGYAARPVLRQLVHRGGLRADILEGGEIRVGDRVRIRPQGL